MILEFSDNNKQVNGTLTDFYKTATIVKINYQFTTLCTEFQYENFNKNIRHLFQQVRVYEYYIGKKVTNNLMIKSILIGDITRSIVFYNKVR